MRFRSSLAVGSIVVGLLAPWGTNPTFAAEEKSTSIVDPEEQLDDGLKGFGYLTGLALGCVEISQRSMLERESLDLNAEIARMFGTDRAYLFAAAFGYGSSVTLKLDECKTVLARYEMRVSKFRQGRGGVKK